MFTLKYSDVRSEAFIHSLHKLENAKGLPSKQAYDVGQIIKEVITGMRIVQDAYHALLKKYAVLDSEGNFVKSDKAPEHLSPQEQAEWIKNSFTIALDKREEWKKVLPEFAEQTFTVHRHKIPLDTLTPCNFTPAEITALEAILLV